MTVESPWETLADRLEVSGEHLLWTGKVKRGTVPAVGVRNLSVRRLLYEAQRGPLPEGANLRRTCPVARCVHPRHAERIGLHRPRGERAYTWRKEGMAWKDIARRLGFRTAAHACMAAKRYAEQHGLPGVRAISPVLAVGRCVECARPTMPNRRRCGLCPTCDQRRYRAEKRRKAKGAA